MARSRLLLCCLLGPLLVAGLGMAALYGRQDRPPVYSVAQVEAQLARHPRAWMDRTLLLRGVAEVTGCVVYTPDGTTFCATPQLVLGDARPTAVAPLPLVWAGPDPLLAVVRRVPLLGSFAPAPQMVHWDVAATYRTQLRAAGKAPCGTPPCYEALLLDAAP